MSVKNLLFLSVIMMNNLSAVTDEALHILSNENPFVHNLGINIISAAKADAPVMLCCHGYGHNNQIADIVHSYRAVPHHIVGFNFPDHDIRSNVDHTKTSFGTLNEIMPLLYLIKRTVCDVGVKQLSLYGFSAGGGAVVNALVVLMTAEYDAQLETYGITSIIKKQMIDALKQGIIILDCPLKSIEEIIALRGAMAGFDLLAKNYIKNGMRPIDALLKLEGMAFTIFLHFQKPDEILSNRDDALFAQRLHAMNKGKTETIIGADGGHNAPHTSLWKRVKKIT